MSDSYTDEQPAKSGMDSPNNTNFNPREAASDKRRKYRRLWFYNENLKRDRNNTNSTEVRRRERNHILDSISASLGLPDYQHKEAQNIIENTTFTESVGGRYLSIETYCYAICVLVWNDDHEEFSRKVLPGTSKPDRFEKIQESVEITDDELEQALNELGYDVIKNA